MHNVQVPGWGRGSMKQARAGDSGEMHVFQQKMHLAENCKLSCMRRSKLLPADLRNSWIELKEGLGKETIWKQG